MNEFTDNPIPSPSLPKPTVSGVFGHSWETLKKYFPELLLVLFLEVLISLPVGFTNSVFFPFWEEEMYSNLFNVVYGFLVLAPVSYGCSWVFLKAVRDEAFRVTDMFFAFQQIGQVILANILVAVIVVLGMVMLVVPGIIFACKLAFVPYLVMDEKMSATDAVKKSWEMTKGYSWTIFRMGVVSFFVIILGVICLVVGIIPAIIWISLAFAGIYHVVSETKKAGK
jgi:uncharacterized membrane protein